METIQFMLIIFLCIISAVALFIDAKYVNEEQCLEEDKCYSIIFLVG